VTTIMPNEFTSKEMQIKKYSSFYQINEYVV